MGAPATETGGSTGPIALVLAGAGGPHPVGQPVPLTIEIRNLVGETVLMVGVVSGSEEGIRYPHYAPSVTYDGAVVAAPGPAEDPLVGPLRAVDFRRLAPGRGFDPTRSEQGAAYLPLATFANFRPSQAGAYSFELTLSTESADPEEWLGKFNQDNERAAVLELVERVPRFSVTSQLLVDVT